MQPVLRSRDADDALHDGANGGGAADVARDFPHKLGHPVLLFVVGAFPQGAQVLVDGGGL